MWQNEFNADIFDMKCQMTESSVTAIDENTKIDIEFYSAELEDMMQDKSYVGNSILSLGGNYAVATRDERVADIIRNKKQVAGNVLFVNGTRWIIINATAVDRRTLGQQFGGANRYISVFVLG